MVVMVKVVVMVVMVMVVALFMAITVMVMMLNIFMQSGSRFQRGMLYVKLRLMVMAMVRDGDRTRCILATPALRFINAPTATQQ